MPASHLWVQVKGRGSSVLFGGGKGLFFRFFPHPRLLSNSILTCRGGRC